MLLRPKVIEPQRGTQVALPGASASPCVAPVLTLTPEEDLIKDGAHEEGDRHDHSHDEEEERVEGAAPAAEEGTSGAAIVRAAAGAVAAAVGGMLAMVYRQPRGMRGDVVMAAGVQRCGRRVGVPCLGDDVIGRGPGHVRGTPGLLPR